MATRLFVLTVLFYGFYAFYDIGMQDWYLEKKFENKRANII